MTRSPLVLPVQIALDAFRQDRLSATALSDTVRQQHELLAALPPRYREVLMDLLNRLESSALFSEESCSFSQSDLLDHLQQWIDKAQSTLAASD